MFKSIWIISIISMAALVGACGGKSGRDNVPQAVAIPDESEAVFTGEGASAVPYYDEAAELISQTDPTCSAQDKAGHRIIDSRIVPNSVFETTIQVGRGGPDLQKYTITSTIRTSDTVSYTRKDDFAVPGSPHTEQISCDFKNVTGPVLNCLDQNMNRATKLVRHTGDNNCHVTSPNGDKDIKITYQRKKWTISGKSVDAIRRVSEHDGLLTCNKRDIGPGKDILVEVYSYDVPSLVKDACAPAQIFMLSKKMDNAGNIYENTSEKLTSYLTPTDSPVVATSTSEGDPQNPFLLSAPVTPSNPNLLLTPSTSSSGQAPQATTSQTPPASETSKVVPPPPQTSNDIGKVFSAGAMGIK